jgi:uncharacterized membrane protein (UPF0127 family)
VGETVRVVNRTRDSVLGDRIALARTPWTRLIGLLGRDGLEAGGGMWLEPCDSVHMLFMRFPLDIVFVDAEGTVVDVVAGLKPWRVTWPRAGARATLELPVGAVARTGTRPGDILTCEVPCASS